MNYIIDANNLAGKLDLLDEDNFDKKLIQIIQDYLGNKQKIIVLVFDSLDPLGDKLDLGNLQVIYSARDNYNKSADDKILEIFKQWSYANCSDGEMCKYSLNIIKKISKNNLAFVSDDLSLRNKVSEIKEGINEKIKLMYNDDFIAKMNRYDNMKEADDGGRDLGSDEVDDINNELLEIWK
jgi:hypothetical protein